jgi:hypothetical protein
MGKEKNTVGQTTPMTPDLLRRIDKAIEEEKELNYPGSAELNRSSWIRWAILRALNEGEEQ